ncbi:hypothetical protein AAVH_30326 [Aphelenchoides avenae]|nr:hypothetical protein AAVH_30326 [Aphelenchus avenae]
MTVRPPVAFRLPQQERLFRGAARRLLFIPRAAGVASTAFAIPAIARRPKRPAKGALVLAAHSIRVRPSAFAMRHSRSSVGELPQPPFVGR